MTRKKEDASPGAATPAGDRRMIRVDLIDPNPWNGHRAADDDLVASIREHGILQNLVVRPAEHGIAGEQRYELVSGTRRAWAAKLAELTEAPCLVCELTDREAREITIIENLQREDLHPVDEAKAIAALLDDGHSKEEVAARIGKTAAFVTRRVKLANLSEQIIEQAGEDLRRMSIRALELLATLPEAKQFDLFDGWGGVTLDAKGIARQIQRESHAITGAAFDCADETLIPEAGACMNCPKRTGFEPLLFDDLGEVAQEDSCLDLACYERKREAALARREAQLREKHGDKLRLAIGYIPYGEAGADMRKRGVVEIGYGHYETCKKKDACAEPALVIDGDKAGKQIWIRKHQVHDDPKSADQAEPDTPADPMERKREKLDQRRMAWCASKLTELVRNSELPAERYQNNEDMVFIASCFGGDAYSETDTFDLWATGYNSPQIESYKRIWEAAHRDICGHLQVCKVSDLDDDFRHCCELAADLVDKPWDDLWAEACEAIPEPKAWSRA